MTKARSPGNSWPVSRIEEVLAHYSASGALSWSIKNADTLFGTFLLSGNMPLLRKRLPSWVQVRSQYAESLAQLERLAQATHCRMERAEDFFSARGFGASAGPSAPGLPPAGRKRCLRCDLCYANLARQNGKSSRGAKSSFEMFQEASP